MGVTMSAFLLPGPVRWTPAHRTQLVGAVRCVVYRGTGPDVIVFAHGNGECLGSIEDRMEQLARGTGCTVVAFRYPGYGPQGGKRRPRYCVGQMRFVLANARDMLGEGGRLVAMGQSIGAAVAAQAVMHSEIPTIDKYPVTKVDHLVLVSPFSSVADMADHLAFSGASWVTWSLQLRTDTLDTVTAVGQISVPTLVMHGENDELIPFAQSTAVHEASVAQWKRHVMLAGVGHNDLVWERVVGGVCDHMTAVARGPATIQLTLTPTDN